MPQLLDGKAVAAALCEKLRAQTAELKSAGITPVLATVRLGERGDDIAYERGAAKRCQSVGIDVRNCVLPEQTTQEQLLSLIASLNADPNVHGCLIFMPLPRHIDAAAVCAALAPQKDVDGITPVSQAGVYSGRATGFPPCTPQACMEILDHYGIDAAGKNAVVIGRSLVVGKPAA
ncbi:MAG: tetrahydrofolate dehydrogenase/cyclohydrolase catalytic domain-containing protein, partial [Pyramidobacter sp.]|nr:tetrahydrofolate dehydrogenase/cyclohydrolase catalytic domain-containing protein [Pyramidobacter sp.]